MGTCFSLKKLYFLIVTQLSTFETSNLFFSHYKDEVRKNEQLSLQDSRLRPLSSP